MNILFFIRHYFDTWGGIEENVSKISEYLSNNNIVSITSNNVDFSHRAYRKNIRYIKHIKVKITDFDVVFIENFEIVPHLIFIVKVVINRLLNKKNPKIILVPHGGFVPYWKSFSFFKKIIKINYNRFVGLWFINNYCDLTIAVSDWEKNELIKNDVKTEIIVIRNGYDSFLNNSWSLGTKKDYFVFVGRIDPIKNIEDIILTFKKITVDPRFNNFKLKIVGDYNKNKLYFNKLNNIISNYSLERRIEFVGPKYNEDKYKLISEAKCLFCLSLLENDPVVIKEAFSVGTKVVINNNYGLNDFVGENNIFIKNGDNINPDHFYRFIDNNFNNNFLIPINSWKEVSKEYEKIF